MNRDRHLFWELTKPEHLRARAFCRKLAGHREDGDDLYQDALVTALTRFDTLRDTAAFRGWLYRIIVNSFKNRVRRPWWKRFGPLTDDLIESTVGENPLESRAARRKLEIAFAAVTPEAQALVTLFELDGWSIAEIAAMFDQSEGAIKMRLSRTRRKMRQSLVRHKLKTGTGQRATTKLSEEEICAAAKQGLD